jgi:hypothetical protein
MTRDDQTIDDIRNRLSRSFGVQIDKDLKVRAEIIIQPEEGRSDRKIIERGLAPTSTQARAQALKVAASHALWQPTDSARFFKGPASTEAP